jgi:predicted peptidase
MITREQVPAIVRPLARTSTTLTNTAGVCTIAIVSLALLPGCASSPHTTATGPGMHAETFTGTVSRTVSAQYLISLPEGYGTVDQKWPLVLFLHGAGERGADLELVKKHGPPRLIAEGKTFPFIMVAPQCPEGQWWSEDVLIALLDKIESDYSVDRSREYLTGLSMGGFGTWRLAMLNPDRFAAIMPVCGGGDEKLICAIKNVPAWAFHGAKDPVVPLSESQKIVDALKACGGDPKLTVYPEAGHDSWTETYNNPEVYTWLLSHSLKH